MAAEATSRITVAPQPVPVRIARRAWRLRRLPLIPIFILAMFVVTGIAAPWIAPHDSERGDVRARNLPPAWSEGGSTEYLLGTDHLGRDVMTRVIYGARISLIVAVVALGVGGIVGVSSGLVAGWYGRWVDELIMRIVDIKLAIPTILLALVLVLALGQTFLIIVVVLGIAVWPRFARNIRGEVLQLKTMDYVSLAKVAGASTPRILFIHIFPGVINTLIILATLEVGIVILLESTLSFLGAGVPPPTPAWGSMVSEGRDRLAVAWWISTMPGLAIMLIVLSMNLFGDWLRDKLDPRLRQLD
jgi:peptide/nickel transport system permease protein